MRIRVKKEVRINTTANERQIHFRQPFFIDTHSSMQTSLGSRCRRKTFGKAIGRQYVFTLSAEFSYASSVDLEQRMELLKEAWGHFQDEHVQLMSDLPSDLFNEEDRYYRVIESDYSAATTKMRTRRNEITEAVQQARQVNGDEQRAEREQREAPIQQGTSDERQPQPRRYIENESLVIDHSQAGEPPRERITVTTSNELTFLAPTPGRDLRQRIGEIRAEPSRSNEMSGSSGRTNRASGNLPKLVCKRATTQCSSVHIFVHCQFVAAWNAYVSSACAKIVSHRTQMDTDAATAYAGTAPNGTSACCAGTVEAAGADARHRHRPTSVSSHCIGIVRRATNELGRCEPFIID